MVIHKVIIGIGSALRQHRYWYGDLSLQWSAQQHLHAGGSARALDGVVDSLFKRHRHRRVVVVDRHRQPVQGGPDVLGGAARRYGVAHRLGVVRPVVLGRRHRHRLGRVPGGRTEGQRGGAESR